MFSELNKQFTLTTDISVPNYEVNDWQLDPN